VAGCVACAAPQSKVNDIMFDSLKCQETRTSSLHKCTPYIIRLFKVQYGIEA